MSILLFEINRKIGELAKSLPQGTRKTKLEPKFKRLGLKTYTELHNAQFVNNHHEEAEEMIQESIDNGEIPTVRKFKDLLNGRKPVTRESKILKQLNEISVNILNLSQKKDGYFLNKSKKVLEGVLETLNDKQMFSEIKGESI